MSTIVSISNANKSRESQETRQKIVAAVIQLITDGGLEAASPQRISKLAGVSLGAVQNFGNRTQLLDAVFLYGHEKYLSLVDHEELLQGTLHERVQLYVTMSWQHYQSDLYLAVLEILLATRSSRDASTYLQLAPELGEHHRAQVRKIFPECSLDDRNLMEVMRSTHLFLTGLAIDKLLEPDLPNLGGYLRRVVASMKGMIQDQDS
ncbi:TetR/AcrR family transcriptional regulator [Oceanicoccus sagamiensis]|uniref:HTH tetR-type domain-containing protein n=1 Tax=Oceanicoccus sagamiensis TaxID=716816 RepID=A0A1X9NFV7_9GAMM|nr:TetR/AcrR family transcriptional regulator [Oceanicoccus sagamiensis]ARN76061.1 hypothetical protein BST96_19345 [Oceanicoccus sagamiensis]